MNTILTNSISDPNVLMPWTGPSLAFLQDANLSQFKGAFESVIGYTYDASKYYIMRGLEPYGTNQYYSGYVYYNGEAFYCSGKTNTNGFTHIPVLNLTITNDPTADPLTFSDNVQRNVHNIRSMVLTDAISGSTNLSACTRINDYTHYIGGSGEPAFQNSWANWTGYGKNCSFTKISDIVYIQGAVYLAGSINVPIFYLPESYRPSSDIVLSVANGYNSGQTNVQIYAYDGAVVPLYGSNQSLYLDSLIFRKS